MSLYEVKSKVAYLIYPSYDRISSRYKKTFHTKVEKDLCYIQQLLLKNNADVRRAIIFFIVVHGKHTEDVALSRNRCWGFQFKSLLYFLCVCKYAFMVIFFCYLACMYNYYDASLSAVYHLMRVLFNKYQVFRTGGILTAFSYISFIKGANC